MARDRRKLMAVVIFCNGDCPWKGMWHAFRMEKNSAIRALLISDFARLRILDGFADGSDFACF